MSWIGLREGLAAFARAEGLLDVAGIPSLPGKRPSETSLAAGVIAQLRQVPDGFYIFVTHPMCDDEEGRQRDLDRRALLDPVFGELAAGGEVRFVRYDEVLASE